MKKFITIFIISFLAFAVIIGSGAYYYLGTLNNNCENFDVIVKENPELKPPDAKDENITNVLFMGIDEARSDFMLLARYNKENDKIVMISIPRDTRVNITNYGFDKINHATAKKEGIPLAMDTVGNLLDIPVHYYVELTFKGMENIVNIIGGVRINVPKDMNYEAPDRDLYIDIKKGEQTLNGENAVKFVRYRSGYADRDLGRIRAQQDFIKAFIKQITSPKIIPKAFNILQAMSKCVKTNMGENEIAYYALKLKDLNIDDIKMYTLPGEPDYIDKISYFIYDEEKLKEMNIEIDQELRIQKSAGESTVDIDADSNTDINS